MTAAELEQLRRQALEYAEVHAAEEFCRFAVDAGLSDNQALELLESLVIDVPRAEGAPLR